MKIFLATAATQDVTWAATHGLVDGVLVTPASLLREGGDARGLLSDLCRLVEGPIFAPIRSLDASGAYRHGRELAKLSDQIIVQLPLVEDTLGAMKRLQAEGVRVATTHVFNAAQALLAARAGASSVVTDIEQLDAAGHDGVDVVRAIRAAFDQSNAECDVIAVNPSSPTEFGACAAAGADATALSSDLCRALLWHPLTDRGVEQYLDDVAHLNRSWLPGI